MKNSGKILLLALMMGTLSHAQDSVNDDKKISKEDKKIMNWYNNSKTGMSTDLAYKKLLAGRKSTPVVVGVLDSGVDIEHEDLKGKIWVNTDEIPNNGIDDDKNGYIDDVNGWSFLGNANGENANDAQLAVTRLYAKLDKKYKGKSEGDLIDSADADEFAKYLEYKKVVESSKEKAEKRIAGYKGFLASLDEGHEKMKSMFGADYSDKDIKKLMKSGDEKKMKIAQQAAGYKEKDEIAKELEGAMNYFQTQIDFYYNPDFTGDRDIIGDNPDDYNDKYYGSKDAEGPDAGHGTHVAGIIGANRNNSIGMNGVADNAIIMSVRSVPNGDERDKDVALAIRYAVDNGAKVLNMSFGKDYAENSAEVISAIRYAEKKDVLLVHAAGNDGKNVDVEPKFPTSIYPSMSERFSNWLDIGAATRFEKPQYKKEKREKFYQIWKKRKQVKTYSGRAASFSNYGKTKVDVFAPGKEIYSTVPQSDYATYQGTSMAAPMVAGVAALLKSYFPNLTMMEIRSIILDSAIKADLEVIKPGTKDEMVNFTELSREGAVVNVYKAVELAIERSKK
ncbi:MAG: S8 family serine peptidase [Flavobacteriales bacterium]